MASKTMYHSELAQMGPVRVTVKTDVMKSKYSKPNAPKPDYVVLEINGEERSYNTENEACAAFFRGADGRGTKGRTFTIVAEGSRDAATITYVGEGVASTPPPAAAPSPAPATHAAPPPPHTAPPPAPRAAAPPPPAGKRFVPMGQTVGMAINNACASLTAQGRELEPKAVLEIASDLLRCSRWLETGDLMPNWTQRHAPPQAASAPPASKPPPAPTSPANPEPAEPEEDDVPF